MSHCFLLRKKISRPSVPKEILIGLGTVLVLSGCNRAPENREAQQLAASVKTEFLHAWQNYERYAWGHDALKPLSKTAHDWCRS